MLYYSLGDAIVARDEFMEKSVKELPRFYAEFAKGKASEVRFSTGKLTNKNIQRSFSPGLKKSSIPFQPIGPGKPLTIQIREIYTGKHPSTWFESKKDMLITSAVKSIATFDAKPRAINFLQKDVAHNSRLYRPKASGDGTPIVFYTPALVDKSITLDLEIVFDQWELEIFDQISKAFQTTASVPIFLPYSIYLLAASTIVKLTNTASEALFDGKPSFSATEPLDIQWPGAEPAQPGFLMVTQGDVDTIDPAFREKYHANEAGQVVDSSGKQYNGDIPYVIISLDGTKNDELASWAPTAASAAVLGRFLGMNNGQSQSMEMLVTALKLYNDYTFRQKVDRLDKQISAEEDPDNKAKLMQEREATAKNILEDLLRPAGVA